MENSKFKDTVGLMIDVKTKNLWEDLEVASGNIWVRTSGHV